MVRINLFPDTHKNATDIPKEIPARSILVKCERELVRIVIGTDVCNPDHQAHQINGEHPEYLKCNSVARINQSSEKLTLCNTQWNL